MPQRLVPESPTVAKHVTARSPVHGSVPTHHAPTAQILEGLVPHLVASGLLDRRGKRVMVVQVRSAAGNAGRLDVLETVRAPHA